MTSRLKTSILALFAVGLAGAIASVSSSQARPEYVISLRSRAFTPVPGLDRLAVRALGATDDSVVHVILQFDSVPTVAQRMVLSRRHGVELLSPLTGPAYFAAMRSGVEAARALTTQPNRRIRWIGGIRPEDKVARSVLRDSVPSERTADNNLVLLIRFFDDTEVDGQRQVLRRHRLSDSSPVPPLNGWAVVLPRDSVLALAAEDVIQWIGEMPGPPELDNDGVRRASGLNADSVLAAPYGLSGSGITIGLWDFSPASLTHDDFAGRISLGDPPEPPWSRMQAHDETVLANGAFDAGEGVYLDVDDSETVTKDDVRITTITPFLVKSVVQPGDADVGDTLVIFGPGPPTTSDPGERFADNVVVDGLYSENEPIYRDTNNDLYGAAGERIGGGSHPATPPVLRPFPTNPHYHATEVAGTIMGSGALSALMGGSAKQWKGVAPEAQLRTYSVCSIPCWATTWNAASPWLPSFSADLLDAGTNGTTITVHPWGVGHCNEVFAANACYDVIGELFDAVASGRKQSGAASGLARMAVIGSAGNIGFPERHTDGNLNGRYDGGEAIYVDVDGDGRISTGDNLLTANAGTLNDALIDFDADERHTETAVGGNGSYNDVVEGIYVDGDGSGSVSTNDVRISGPLFSNGTTLRPFRLFRNLRVGNSAKNTLQVGAGAFDAPTVPAFSSRGPTEDGRLKPDLVAPGSENGGDGLIWTTNTRDRYRGDLGTSMASAAAAGSAALVAQWYQEACASAGAAPEVIKALLIHGAEDVKTTIAGTFAGPDYVSGFGRLRVKEAIDLVPHHIAGTVSTAGNVDVPVAIGRRQTLRVTLAWSDPPRAPNVLPTAGNVLVNNLDLVVIGPDGTQYTPWLLDPAQPFQAATRAVVPSASAVPASARDQRNPVEQVVVDNAAPGTWIIRVVVLSGALKVPGQDYVLASEVISPLQSPCTNAPAADVWIRDNATDTGATPSSGALWLGPDLWNRLAPDATTAHENPEHGQPNYLYANVRNASAVTVKATTMELHIADASTGLSWPVNFTYVGRIMVPNLAPGETRQVGPLQWLPPAPLQTGHYCMYMRVVSPQDPIGFVEAPAIGANAQNSNNIAYRNLIIVDLMSSRTVAFLVRNTEDEAGAVDVRIQVPAAFLERGQVSLAVSPRLAERWRSSAASMRGLVSLSDSAAWRDAPVDQPLLAATVPFRITATEAVLPPIVLAPQQTERITMVIYSSDTRTAAHDVDVIQRMGERIVGGIRYVVRTGGRQ